MVTEVVKGVPGVTHVRVVTITEKATGCDVAGQVTAGKKRLAAFVGPPGKDVTEKVFAECHRRLKESGMVPFWVKEMPAHASDVNYDMELEKLLAQEQWTEAKGSRSKFIEDKNLAITAAETAYGKLA